MLSDAVLDGMKRLVTEFDDLLFKTLNSPSLFGGRLRFSNLVYDDKGLGFIRYAKAGQELYELNRRQVLTTRRGLDEGKGATSDPNLPLLLRGATDDSWMLCRGAHTDATLSQMEYTAALCLKVNELPERVALPVTCNCGKALIADVDFIEHVFACDRFTSYTHTHRHNDVMYDALIGVTKAYGLVSTAEPRFYEPHYASGEKRRPDIHWRTSSRLTTDVTVVSPMPVADLAGHRAAEAKMKAHRDAVHAMGHNFIPFVCEIQGHMHKSAHDVIDKLARELLPAQQRSFRSDMRYAVSAALAKGRANAVLAAIARARSNAHAL